MANTTEKIDIEKAKKTAEHVFGILSGALVSAMIYLGDRMGLYQVLSGAGADHQRGIRAKDRAARTMDSRMALRAGGRQA